MSPYSVTLYRIVSFIHIKSSWQYATLYTRMHKCSRTATIHKYPVIQTQYLFIN